MLLYVLEVALCGSSVLLLWPVMRLRISARGKQERAGRWGPMICCRSSVIFRTSRHCCPWCYHKHTAGDQVFSTQPLGGLTLTMEAVLKTWRNVGIGGKNLIQGRRDSLVVNECWLLSQRTRGQSLAPTLGSWQLPVTPPPGRSDALVWPLWTPAHVCTYFHTDTHIWLKSKYVLKLN